MTRGERNHNPGNLEGSIHWLGVTGQDGPYAIFSDDASGLRALAKNIRNQQRLHGLDTVAGIIAKFAPPNENNTSAYVGAVCAYLGVDKDQEISLEDNGVLSRFVRAVILHENGRCSYTDRDIDDAVAQLRREDHAIS